MADLLEMLLEDLADGVTVTTRRFRFVIPRVTVELPPEPEPAPESAQPKKRKNAPKGH